MKKTTKKLVKKIVKALDDKRVQRLAVLGNTKEESAINFLGHMGTMVSGSKSDYCNRNPGHTVFFNANLYDAKAVKLWYGDLDLTKSSAKVQALADAMGETLYVTTESPYRFFGMFGDDEKLTVARLEADARFEKYPQVIAFNPQERK